MKHNLHHQVILYIILLMGIVGFQTSYAGTWNVIVKQADSIDYCGNGDVILEVVVDQDIYFADSIYGFDFDIEYNSDKFSFYQILEPGTLYGKVNTADGGLKFVNYGIKGLIQVSFSSKQRPIASSRVLVRILGKLKNDCADTSYTFMTFFESDHEFSKIHNFYPTFPPTGYRLDIVNRKSSLKPLKATRYVESVRIDTNSRVMDFSYSITKNDPKRGKKFITTITADDETTKTYIDSMFIKEYGSGVEIVSQKYSNGVLNVEFGIPTGSDTSKLEYRALLRQDINLKDSLDLKLNAYHEEKSECTCSRLNEYDTLMYEWRKPKDTIPSSVSDERKLAGCEINRFGNRFYVTKGNKGNCKAKIYNVFGELLEIIQITGTHEILQNIENGCFFISFFDYEDKKVSNKSEVVKIIK